MVRELRYAPRLVFMTALPQRPAAQSDRLPGLFLVESERMLKKHDDLVFKRPPVLLGAADKSSVERQGDRPAPVGIVGLNVAPEVPSEAAPAAHHIGDDGAALEAQGSLLEAALALIGPTGDTTHRHTEEA